MAAAAESAGLLLLPLPGGVAAAAAAAVAVIATAADTTCRIAAREQGLARPTLQHSNMKIHLEKNLEEERQKLLQEQRICRSRARKYSIESNRRRKAFEEKRKKEEEKEHQIREQILQQRKQKLEEVTEKFQRAHVPSSQRRRAVYQKPVPRLEEALEQIQGFSLKQESNFSSSKRPTINWKSLPACPAVSTPSSPDQLSPPQASVPYQVSQSLPTCPILSTIHQLQNMPLCPSVSPKLPDSFLPASNPSYQTIYLPHPPSTFTPGFSGCLPHLPAPILSEPPKYLPRPPQRSTISDPAPHNKLFYKSSRPNPFHPTRFSTPSVGKPALVRRSLPTRLVVSPVHSEAVLPILMPSCSSNYLPYPPAPIHSYVPGCLSQLPQHPVNPDLVQTIDSAVASAVTKIEPMYQKHLSSRIYSDKDKQENIKISWAVGQEDSFQHNLEETQHLLEELHLSSVQDLHEEVNQLTNSETLSSIDSLEAGDHEEIYSTLSKALSSATQQNSVSHNSQSPQTTNQVYFDAGELHLSKTQHINNWLINLGDQNTQTASPFPDFINKHNDHFNNPKLKSFALNRIGERSTDASDNTVAIIHSPCTFAQDKKAEKTSETFSIWKIDSLSSRMFKRERPLVAESPTFRFSKTWTTSCPSTRETVQSSEHDKCPELTQPNRTTSIPASNIPMATPVILPSSQWTNYKSTYSNIHSTSFLQKNNMHLEEICPIQCTDGLDNLKDIKDEKMKTFGGNNQALPFLFPDALSASFMYNNPDQMSMKDKNEKTVGITPSLSNNSDLVGQPKKSKHNNHERNGVKLLKSILKKESKYENDYFKALIINRGISLGNQTAAAIRDSVELTKAKGKGSEIQKSIKKLRWFDEIGQTEKEDGENSLKTGLASSQPTSVQTKVSSTSNVNVHTCAINSASCGNHKDILGIMKYENAKGNSVIPKNITTQMSETDNVSLHSFVPSGKSFAKQAWITSKKEEGKFPIRNNDSKTQKTIPRSGIIKLIRRSRACKVQSGITSKNKKGTVSRPQTTNEANKTQGKLIAPHPPHKPVTNTRISKTVKDSQCQQVMPTKSQSSTISSRNLGSRYVFPTGSTQESNPSFWNTNSSDLVTSMPSLPSYRTSECQTSAKINHSMKSTQMIAQKDGSLICAQRSPLCEENSHSLKPIEEKVGFQWKEEHSAIGQNENAADSTSARRKINLESNENKQRALLEQRRQISNSTRQKCTEQPQNIIHPIQLSSSEPVQSLSGISNPLEVSESTAQFLMAENLVKTSVPEDKILTAMKSTQPYKPTLPLHKTQRLNIGALSFEEQKIIESLNHLNQRLHYVQEAIYKNPSIKSILQIASPLNSQPWTTSLSIGCSVSTEVQSQTQRKY